MKTNAHLWFHLAEIHLRMRNFSGKNFRKNQNTHVTVNSSF
jgi:hypothetical protein